MKRIVPYSLATFILSLMIWWVIAKFGTKPGDAETTGIVVVSFLLVAIGQKLWTKLFPPGKRASSNSLTDEEK